MYQNIQEIFKNIFEKEYIKVCKNKLKYLKIIKNYKYI